MVEFHVDGFGVVFAVDERGKLLEGQEVWSVSDGRIILQYA